MDLLVTDIEIDVKYESIKNMVSRELTEAGFILDNEVLRYHVEEFDFRLLVSFSDVITIEPHLLEIKPVYVEMKGSDSAIMKNVENGIKDIVRKRIKENY